MCPLKLTFSIIYHNYNYFLFKQIYNSRDWKYFLKNEQKKVKSKLIQKEDFYFISPTLLSIRVIISIINAQKNISILNSPKLKPKKEFSGYTK
jgi:hypothetical protein